MKEFINLFALLPEVFKTNENSPKGLQTAETDVPKAWSKADLINL